MTTNIKYCFVDTNVLIHYQTYDELDWQTILRSKQVVIVLAPIVIAELNQYKDDSSNEWRRKRTRTLVSKFRSQLGQSVSEKPVEIRPGTSLMDISTEPLIDWAAFELDPRVNDDRLIASILRFVETHSLDDVILLTDDYLSLRKAQSRGLTVIEVEGLIKPIERPADDTSTVNKLQKQIEELKNRVPEPRFTFWENDATTIFVTRKVKAQNSSLMSEDEINRQVSEKRNKMEQLVTNAQRTISSSKIEEFRQEYEKYLAELKYALVFKRSTDAGRSVTLNFVLQNIGSTPALDLQLSLHFPDRFLVVGESHLEYLGQVRIPKEPVAEWTRKIDPLNFSNFAYPVDTPRSQVPEQPGPRGPLYDSHNRNIVNFTTPKLRHKDDWNLKPLVAFLSPETNSGFEIAYDIHADNLLDRITGHLNVVLQEE